MESPPSSKKLSWQPRPDIDSKHLLPDFSQRPLDFASRRLVALRLALLRLGQGLAINLAHWR